MREQISHAGGLESIGPVSGQLLEIAGLGEVRNWKEQREREREAKKLKRKERWRERERERERKEERENKSI